MVQIVVEEIDAIQDLLSLFDCNFFKNGVFLHQEFMQIDPAVQTRYELEFIPFLIDPILDVWEMLLPIFIILFVLQQIVDSADLLHVLFSQTVELKCEPHYL